MIAQNRIIGDRIVKRAARPSASTILQFPVLARRAFIAKIAAAMKRKRSDDASEQYLADELRRYSRQKLGTAPAALKREVCAMEPGVRGELWRLMFGPS
jgi:hypothetical protein